LTSEDDPDVAHVECPDNATATTLTIRPRTPVIPVILSRSTVGVVRYAALEQDFARPVGCIGAQWVRH